MTGQRSLLLGVTLLWAAACGATARGSLTDYGFESRFGYAIPYRQGTKLLLPKGWFLDNFYRNQSTAGKWEPKETNEYVTTFKFDNDGDGKADNSVKEFGGADVARSAGAPPAPRRRRAGSARIECTIGPCQCAHSPSSFSRR